jgi:two-component SAPR family response regulator
MELPLRPRWIPTKSKELLIPLLKQQGRLIQRSKIGLLRTEVKFFMFNEAGAGKE